MESKYVYVARWYWIEDWESDCGIISIHDSLESAHKAMTGHLIRYPKCRGEVLKLEVLL